MALVRTPGRAYVRPRRLLTLALAALASLGLILFALVRRQAITETTWHEWQSRAPAPWSELLTASLGPRTVQIFAGLGAVYLAIALLSLLLAWPLARAVAGDGTITLLRRLVGFIWLPVTSMAYLLTHLDEQTLFVRFRYDGEVISLSLVTILAVIAFGSAVALVVPHPRQTYLAPLFDWVAWLALGVITAGAVLSLDAIVRPDSFPLDGLLTPTDVANLTLVSVEIIFAIAVLEALKADFVEIRIQTARSRLSAAFAAVRLVIRSVVLGLPIAVGLWMATGWEDLPASSRFIDHRGELLYDHFPFGQYRIPLSGASMSPWLLLATDAVEDPGVETAPWSHIPLNPIGVARVFYEAVRSAGASGDVVTGASGIGSQTCKAFSGRPITRFVSGIMNRTAWVPYLDRLAIIGEKVLFEFPCGWAYTRAARVLHPDRSPVPNYLNLVEFNYLAFGVEAAARTYFGTSARTLDLPRSALLIGLLQAPVQHDPWVHPESALARRDRVLRDMHRRGYITRGEWAAARTSPLGVLPHPNLSSSLVGDFTYFTLAWLDERGYQLSRSGMTVVVTQDLAHQKNLSADLARALAGLRSRDGGEGAAIILRPRTGEVLALAGEVRLDGNALEAGDILEPLVTACALEMGGHRPHERIEINQTSTNSRQIAPTLDQIEALPMGQLMTCLRDSFGIDVHLPSDREGLKNALERSPVRVVDVAVAYAALANGGESIRATPVIRVEDRTGDVVYRAPLASGRRTFGAGTARHVSTLLGQQSERMGLPRSVATQTSTTPSVNWVVGYSSDVVLVARVTREQPQPDLLLANRPDTAGVAAVWAEHVRRGLATR